MMKDPSRLVDYMEQQVRELGFIFKLVGAPGLGEMVCIVDPKDVETVFRTGDANNYPMRFSITEWKVAREELKKPIGLVLE